MSKRRFEKLVHYVIEHCGDPSKLGATKLNKVLWFIDTFSYRLNGESISGDGKYVKRQFGPVPSKILETLTALEQKGMIRIRETTYFGKPKREFVSIKDSDASVFTDLDREIIDEVLAVICNNHTATSISDLSHDIIWGAADMGEEIPLYAVLAARMAPPSKEDMRWADRKITEHRQAVAA